jgi:hypothetical protein
MRRDFNRIERVNTRTLSAAGALGAVRTISKDDGIHANSPSVRIAAGGHTVFSWRFFKGSTWRVQARTRSTDGVLGGIHTLSDISQMSDSPQLSVHPNGDGILAWRQFDGTNWRIQALILSPDGVRGRVHNLSKPGRDAASPGVAADPLGKAVFVWQRFDGASWRVQARTLAADGVLGPIQDLSSTPFESPRIAVGANGSALAVWQRSGSAPRVQGSRGP